ncbi:DUF86 domain-containing protein [Candidatus Saccharibacteria bacterium]|nr:DUF86 domain-containing protein [Candidatus Saccharibacteria bacterium]
MKDEKNIQKMIELIDKILHYCMGIDYGAFVASEILIEACVFNLAQIGETSHKISADIVKLHPEIAWHELYGLRNRLVHDYEGTNPKVVWEIIANDLPVLRRQLDNII